MGNSLALSLLAGAVWGSVNLFLIGQLVRAFLLPEERPGIKMRLLLLVKFPLLYFVGYELLCSELFSTVGLMSGFTLSLLFSSIVQIRRSRVA